VSPAVPSSRGRVWSGASAIFQLQIMLGQSAGGERRIIAAAAASGAERASE
jgi:hypothetical protein